MGFTFAALLFAVFAIGSADRWAQSIVALLVIGAVAPHVISKRVADRPSPVLGLIALAGGLTALQLVPLPHAILDIVTPMTSALRDDGAMLLDTHPWPAVTVDAHATLRALTYFIILFGAAYATLRIAVSERSRYLMHAAVAATCGIAAIVVSVHLLVGATSLYGIYEPQQARPTVLGPLLNTNHLGCLMALGTATSLGLAMFRRQGSLLRATWFVCAAVCAGITAASESRGALVALVAGSLVTLGIRVGQRFMRNGGRSGSRASFVTSSLPIVLVAVCAVVVIVYASAGGVTGRLSRTSLDEVSAPTSRFAIWRDSTTLISESPWLGVGRNAMESALTRVHPSSSFATYAFVENEYLQAVVDWGIPGALALAAGIAWFASMALRRWKDGPLVAGAIGAITVVLVQSTFDFGIELFGVAIPAMLVACTLAYVPLREANPRFLPLVRTSRAALVLLLAGAAALLWLPATSTTYEDHLALAKHADTSLADAREAIERHPLDYYGYARAAETLAKSGDRQAIPLLNHALRLHPTHSGLHLFAARLLLSSGHPEQATIEFGAALRGATRPIPILVEIVSSLSMADAAQAIAVDGDPQRTDEMVDDLVALRHLNVAIAVLQAALSQAYSLHHCEQLFQLALDTKQSDTVASATRLCRNFEPTRTMRTQLAQLALSRHDNETALHVLADVETWDGRVDEKAAAWMMRCDAMIALQKWDEAAQCLHRLEAAGIIDPSHVGEVSRRLQQIKDERAAADDPGKSLTKPKSP
ncbi:MAG: O-antigen ligase family protein [Deltaproteobacteria bacterium]|nr:O-antigen ligase family protein [Deltaproteobacteria bacterium]